MLNLYLSDEGLELKMPDHKLFKINQNAVLRNEDGLILILKKDGKWMLVGGRLEQNETWLEGLHREVREETGIQDFSVERILSVDTSDSQETYIVTFLCIMRRTHEIKISDEHQDYAWLNIEDIDKYEFWHKKIAERLKSL